MPAIAIDENQLLHYEGRSSQYGHALWPSPVVSVATVLVNPDETQQIPQNNFLPEVRMVFREDSFDPVTRIRRGRLYKWSGTHPEDWHVQPHPAYPEELLAARIHGGKLKKRLYAFYSWPAFQELKGQRAALIALGTKEAYTLWRIVDIERIVTAEDLLTLRARTALGVLPELNRDAVPQDGRREVIEMLEKLVDTAYRAGPESVAHLARDAAQCCLGVWMANRRGNSKLRQQDLGPLAKMIEKEKSVSSNVAHTLARLHSRAKPNEQERFSSRPVCEGDAEFALAAVGLLLRELGWAL
jgi:hypothetical protein